MAVIFCKEITNRSRDDDAETNKRYVRTFQVLCDVATDSAATVAAHPEVPQYGETWVAKNALGVIVQTDPTALVIGRVAEQVDANDLHNWLVTVRYAGIQDVESIPWEVDYNPTRYQMPLLRDLNTAAPYPDGKPVVNAAGDPFSGGIMVDRTRTTLVLVKHVLTWNPVTADGYNDTLNQFTFLEERHPPGYAKETCKLTLGATRIPFPGHQTYFWKVRAEIDIDRRGWQPKPLNAGYHELVDVLGIPTRKKIILPGGLTPSLPQPLKPDGSKLPPDSPPGTQIPNYLEFKGYETKDWRGPPLSLEYVG